jgi:hypothetical protein
VSRSYLLLLQMISAAGQGHDGARRQIMGRDIAGQTAGREGRVRGEEERKLGRGCGERGGGGKGAASRTTNA